MRSIVRILLVATIWPLLSGVSSCAINAGANVAQVVVPAVVDAVQQGYRNYRDNNSALSSPTQIGGDGSASLQQYNDHYICNLSISGLQPIWDVTSPMWVNEAKARGLTESQCVRLSGRFIDKQVAASASSSRQSASQSRTGPWSNTREWNNDGVCRQAIELKQPKWESRHSLQRWVSEAKRRGISESQCARLTLRFTAAQIAAARTRERSASSANNNSHHFRHWPDNEVCDAAIRLDQPIWDSAEFGHDVAKKYVVEAKRRGLTESKCARLAGRFTKSQIAAAHPDSLRPAPKNDYTGRTDKSVCLNALDSSHSAYPKWDAKLRYLGYVREANRRGLSVEQCGRLSGRFTETQIANIGKEPPRRIAPKPQPAPKIAKRAPETQQPKPKPPAKKGGGSGTGFIVSKLGLVVTNAHVIKDCRSVSIAKRLNHNFPMEVVARDTKNDLALLKPESPTEASNIGSLKQTLGLKVEELASFGSVRDTDAKPGETVIVAGFPYGDLFSSSIKFTRGIVSSSRGFGDDSSQFQHDAAVQPGNSGGPIYDSSGNIVGVVVARLNKLKLAKLIGSLPESISFGIKATTLFSFLEASGLPVRRKARGVAVSTEKVAEFAERQTVMVRCEK